MKNRTSIAPGTHLIEKFPRDYCVAIMQGAEEVKGNAARRALYELAVAVAERGCSRMLPRALQYLACYSSKREKLAILERCFELVRQTPDKEFAYYCSDYADALFAAKKHTEVLAVLQLALDHEEKNGGDNLQALGFDELAVRAAAAAGVEDRGIREQVERIKAAKRAKEPKPSSGVLFSTPIRYNKDLNDEIESRHQRVKAKYPNHVALLDVQGDAIALGKDVDAVVKNGGKLATDSSGARFAVVDKNDIRCTISRLLRTGHSVTHDGDLDCEALKREFEPKPFIKSFEELVERFAAATPENQNFVLRTASAFI